jgi:hypothetical protein
MISKAVLKFSAMILAADMVDFMNNNLIELLNNWSMETPTNPSEFVS